MLILEFARTTTPVRRAAVYPRSSGVVSVLRHDGVSARYGAPVRAEADVLPGQPLRRRACAAVSFASTRSVMMARTVESGMTVARCCAQSGVGAVSSAAIRAARHIRNGGGSA